MEIEINTRKRVTACYCEDEQHSERRFSGASRCDSAKECRNPLPIYLVHGHIMDVMDGVLICARNPTLRPENAALKAKSPDNDSSLPKLYGEHDFAVSPSGALTYGLKGRMQDIRM